MKDFNFKIPQNIQFGMGSLKKLPEILTESHSDKILLVSDRGLEQIGVVKKVQDIIENAGLMGLPIPAAITKAVDILKQRSETEQKG